MTAEESTKELKSVFAYNLQQYAISYYHITKVLKKDGYIPKRKQSKMKMKKLRAIVKGYCAMVDDVFRLEHGTTLSKWYEAVEKELVLPPSYDEKCHSEGIPYKSMEEKHETERVFAEFMFGAEEYEGALDEAIVQTIYEIHKCGFFDGEGYTKS